MSIVQPFAERVTSQSIQVALVFVLCAVLDALFARAGNARLRAVVWAAFFVKLLLPPDASSPVSIVHVLAPAAEAPRAVEGSRISTWDLGLAVVWASGFIAAVCVAARRLRVACARWSKGAERAAPPAATRLLAELAQRVGPMRSPRLVVRNDVRSGACIGLVSPRIAVAADLLAPHRRAALEHVLLHELGHVRRRDGLRGLAWTLLRCAYWFHPLVHAGARRAALMREMSCDDFAARAGVDGAPGYRRTLLETARTLAGPDLVASGFFGGQIIARIEGLSRPPRIGPRASPAAGAVLFVLLCACCIPLGRAARSAPAAPAFEDLQGCLRKRFAVMAEIERRGGVENALKSP